MLRELLLRGEQELDPCDARIFDMKSAYGLSLYAQCQFAEAAEVLEDVQIRYKESIGLNNLAIALHITAECRF
jgi:hypothetical protein